MEHFAVLLHSPVTCIKTTCFSFGYRDLMVVFDNNVCVMY